MEPESRILVAGGSGMVGQALIKVLQNSGYSNIEAPARQQLDLADQLQTERYFREHRPEIVFLAAGKVGGLVANRDYPAEYIVENLKIYTNCIESAARNGCRKLLFIGSSCIYPNSAPQPISESALLSGPFEPMLEFFGAAKIAGIKLCQAYRRQYGFDAISVMPCSLYGPNDYFDLERAHVLPALLRKFHDAKMEGRESVEIWGSGQPRREFLHVDDFVRALVLRIIELAHLVGEVVGFAGRITLDTERPDGIPRKLLDVSRVRALGWTPEISLSEGLSATYRWMLDNTGTLRR
jgi:GDP-L-fucose synthase